MLFLSIYKHMSYKQPYMQERLSQSAEIAYRVTSTRAGSISLSGRILAQKPLKT